MSDDRDVHFLVVRSRLRSEREASEEAATSNMFWLEEGGCAPAGIDVGMGAGCVIEDRGGWVLTGALWLSSQPISLSACVDIRKAAGVDG